MNKIKVKLLRSYIKYLVLEASRRDMIRAKRRARSAEESGKSQRGPIQQSENTDRPWPEIHEIICLELKKYNNPNAYFVVAVNKSSRIYNLIQEKTLVDKTFNCLTVSSADDDIWISGSLNHNVFYRNAYLRPTSVVKQSIVNGIDGIEWIGKKVNNPTWVKDSIASVESEFGFDESLKGKGYSGSNVGSMARNLVKKVGVRIRDNVEDIENSTYEDAYSMLLSLAEENFFDKMNKEYGLRDNIEADAYPIWSSFLFVLKLWLGYDGLDNEISQINDDFVSQLEEEKKSAEPISCSNDEFEERIRSIINRGYVYWSNDSAYKPENFISRIDKIETDLEKAIALNQGVIAIANTTRAVISKKLKDKKAKGAEGRMTKGIKAAGYNLVGKK